MEIRAHQLNQYHERMTHYQRGLVDEARSSKNPKLLSQLESYFRSQNEYARALHGYLEDLEKKLKP